MSVAVLDVDAQDALTLASADDQDPIEALASHRADEALSLSAPAPAYG